MEVTRIYSIAGMLAKGEGVRRERPFRAPHHTMTPQALAGGGKQPSPGEITLAHRGVLFLDELPEMTRTTIEILRQPLEEHRIVISRVSGNYVFPASFLMVAAMNPCPCGFYPDLSRCTCAPGDISRYLSRVSQPFLDRMDLCVQVEALSYEDLHGEERCESSAKMREKATAFSLHSSSSKAPVNSGFQRREARRPDPLPRHFRLEQEALCIQAPAPSPLPEIHR